MTQAELFPPIPFAVVERAMAAIASETVSPCAREVCRALLFEPAAGREAAMQISALQARWRLQGQRVWSDRDVKASVKELLEVHGVPIGSARSGECGYFLLVCPEDVAAAERPLEAEIRSLARRLRAINPKSEISRLLCGQMGLGDD